MMWDDEEAETRRRPWIWLDPALWARQVIHYVTAVYTLKLQAVAGLACLSPVCLSVSLSKSSPSSAVVITTQSPSQPQTLYSRLPKT
jgi:hypothetical protein